MVSVCHDSELHTDRLSGELTPSPLSACLQQPHQTQQDRKETHRGRPQRAPHTHRDLTLSSTTGALLRDKYALKTPTQPGGPAWKLLIAPDSYSSHSQHLYPHLDSFLVELV